jgi:arginase
VRRYAIVEAPSVLGLWPSGVERLGEALLAHGLAEELAARRAGRVAPPPWVAARDEKAGGLLNPQGIAVFSRALADALGPIIEAGETPVVLGGDCSIVLGSLLALRRRGRPGLLFLDGQADFYQPEAEPKGEAASMDLALATGRGPAQVTDLEGRRPLVRDEDVVVLGYRDAQDAAEHGSQPLPDTIAALDLAAVRRLGAAGAGRRAVERLTRGGGPDRFWIHLDVDVLDDGIMPCVDYRMPGGLSWDELTAVLRIAMAAEQAVGLEITIYNPALDREGTAGRGLVRALAEALT